MAPTIHAAEGQLEEVIVTAQKRAENLQEVPISVQAFNAKALEQKSIVTLSDVGAYVPGLSIQPYPGSSEVLYPSIRGVVPNMVSVAASMPMAVHINGIYLSQTAGMNLAAADLERMEILKGPQGVMSGRNATGGALNLYTVKPELGQFSFKQQITVAERGQFLSKTMVNVPLTGTLAAKVSYLHSDRDNEGIRNSAPGGIKFGEKTADAWRLDLRWKPANNVTVDYGFDTNTTESYETPAQCLEPPNIMMYGGFMSFFAADPRVAAAIAGCTHEKLTSLYYPYAMPKNRNKAEGHTLNVEWEINPSLTFRSITGYRKVDTSNGYIYTAYRGVADIRSDSGAFTILPLGSTPFNGQSSPITLFNESWSQEFQLIGDAGPNFKYTTGIYYAEDKGHQNSGPNLVMYMPSLGSSAGGPLGSDLAMMEKRGISSAKNSSVALFGQISWRPDVLSRKLEIVPGIRYTRDTREATGFNQSFSGFVVTPTATPGVVNGVFSWPAGYAGAYGKNTFSKTTPQLSLNYHWTDDVMFYGKVAKGYTSGGFDLASGSAASFTKGYDPETITSTEFGMKGEFLNRRLRTNLALFQSKYENEQKSVATPNPATGGTDWIIQNVGRSVYNGVELDLTAALTDALRLSLNSAWMDHKYTRFTDLVTGLDVAATRKLVVPKKAYSASVDYRFPALGLPGKLDGNLSYSYRGAQSTPIDLTGAWPASSFIVPPYSVWNGRLALSRIKVPPAGNGDLSVALWGKNLTDKKYTIYDVVNYSTDHGSPWGEPRTYGIDVIYNY
ncbi:TonB-dependent receptor [Denitratisoma oestradiolicum]|uniref:TonB-dependent receptor n=1 Tax=Denitratisoma oestradiolicum TaxID=311182 RepID=UPI001E470C7B|nr:TonB-dependent receptor [Denitratisoma oestradiolicum]